MPIKTKHSQYRELYDENLYWDRVNRNLGWLGDSEKEQRERQERLRDSVIGIVGTGGIGGAVALRLVRMGVRRLKLADPDEFDVSNIQRQAGADLDFFQIANRYALHRSFRAAPRCQFMLNIPTVGHSVFVFKYTKDSIRIEDVYDIPENAEINPAVARRLMERIIPEMPSYPSREMLDHWFIDMQRMPIFGACPPMAERILTERLDQEIMGIPGLEPLPRQPGYAVFDSLTWTAKIVRGKWW